MNELRALDNIVPIGPGGLAPAAPVARERQGSAPPCRETSLTASLRYFPGLTCDREAREGKRERAAVAENPLLEPPGGGPPLPPLVPLSSVTAGQSERVADSLGKGICPCPLRRPLALPRAVGVLLPLLLPADQGERHRDDRGRSRYLPGSGHVFAGHPCIGRVHRRRYAGASRYRRRYLSD